MDGAMGARAQLEVVVERFFVRDTVERAVGRIEPHVLERLVRGSAASSGFSSRYL